MKIIPHYNLYVNPPQPAETGDFPDDPGIYIAFKCITVGYQGKQIKLHTEPIYIGMSDDRNPGRGIRGRIKDHLRDNHADWLKELGDGCEIEYGYITMPINPDIETVEAAMINANKPSQNTEYVDATPYPLNASLSFNGAIGCLKPDISPNNLITKD